MIRNIETFADSPANDRYTALAMRLRISADGNGKHPKVIGVIGVDGVESARTIAGCLAYAAAHDLRDQTLLIDLTGSTVSAGSKNGVPHPIGFSDLVEGACSLEECVQQAPNVKNLFFLPTGRSSLAIRPSVVGILGDAFQSLRQTFDFIVVLLPAASEPQTATLASKLDGNLLVVESERTHVERAKTARGILQESQARTLGVVLSNWQDHVPTWLSRRI